MKGLSKTFIEVTSIFSDVSFLAALFFTFARLQTDKEMFIQFLPWFVCILTIYFLNKALLTRGTTINVLLAINIFAYAGITALGCFFFVSGSGVMTYIFAAVFWGVTCYRAFFTAKDGITPNQTLLYTEGNIIFVAILLWAIGMGQEVSFAIRVPLVISLGCNFVSLMLSRVVTENRTKVSGDARQGSLAVGAFALLIGGFAIGSLSLMFEGVQKGIFTIYTWMEKVIRAVLYIIGAILTWFFSLFPTSVDGMELLPAEQTQAPGAMLETGELNSKIILYVFVALGIVAIVVGLIYLFKAFRSQRVGKITLKVNMQGTVIRRTSFFAMIKGLFVSLIKKICFRITCVKKRNTILGALFYVEKIGRKTGLKRGAGESGGAFLKRFARELNYEEATLNLVDEVSGALDKNFYGNGENSFSKEKIKEFKKQIKNADFAQYKIKRRKIKDADFVK